MNTLARILLCQTLGLLQSIFSFSFGYAQSLFEGVKDYHDLAYVPGGHESEKLDLYLPKEDDKQPLVIWIHGRAFRIGSKDPCPALWLLREGYAVVSINYRLSQQAIFPAQIED